MLGILLSVFLGLAQAQQGHIQVATFCGMNDTDPANTIPNCACQDCLNVEASPHATSVKKRHGVILNSALSISTASVNGSISFIDNSGNAQMVVCNGIACSHSVNGGTFSVFLSTASSSVKQWSMVASNGILYGFNDQQDNPFIYDGTTLHYNVNFATSVPAGKLVEQIQGRLVVANTVAYPNGVYYSGGGRQQDFTLGVNSPDPWIDFIGSNGQQITGLRAWQGSVYIFQQNSITQCQVDDQYTTICSIVSNTIGTNDPNSVVLGDIGIYFKGSDNGFWLLNDGGLVLISLPIKTLMATISSGKAQSNTQTASADWTAGTQTPSNSWSTTIAPGSLDNSSTTLLDNSQTSFLTGTLSGITATTNPGSIQISSAVYMIPNGSFETGDLRFWTCTKSGGSDQCKVVSTSPLDGTYSAVVTAGACVNGQSSVVRIKDAGTTVYSVQMVNGGPTSLITGSAVPTCNPANTLQNCTLSLANENISTRTLTIEFDAYGGSGAGAESILDSSTFTAISTISWISSAGGCATSQWAKLDDVRVNRFFDSSQSSQTYLFQSRIQDTGITPTIGGPFTVSSGTIIEGGTQTSYIPSNSLTFATRSGSSATSGFDSWTAITNGSKSPETSRYIQYESSFTTSVATQTPAINMASLTTAATGQFESQCIQVGSGISSWGKLNCATELTGQGSLLFYSTSAVNCASLPSLNGTTTGWNLTSNNAAISITTHPAYAFMAVSLLGSATDQAQIDACTINWNTGNPPPPTWGIYDSVNNALYWDVAINQSSTNNRMLKYDLNINGWWPFAINGAAPLVYNNSLYWGDSTNSNWYQYGVSGVDTDNGTAINGYFKTKDFGGQSPFQDNLWQSVSIVATNQYAGVLSSTWTFDTGTTGTYDINDSTTSTIPYVRSNQFLPVSSQSRFMNLNMGNAYSNQPFEIDGFDILYQTQPWQVTNQ